MKVKNIMFSGFAAAILMGVGAANAVGANPVTLADQGYVDAKVSAAKAHFDGKYDSTEKLTDLLAEKEDAANKVAELDLKSADGSVDLTKLGALDAQTTTYPSVSAAKAIADAVLSSVDKVSSQVGNLGTDVATLKATVGDADSGLVKAVAENTSAIETLNGDGDGSVAKMAAAAAADAVAKSGHALATDVARDYETKENATAKYATFETKENATAQYATFETKTDAATNLQTAKDYADSAVAALKVAETYETKENATAQYATFETKTDASAKLAEAKKYTDDEIDALGIADYAKTADVNTELAKKLDVVESAGTYMVTRDAEGNISYTKVKVATGVAENGDAVVTE